MPVPTNPYNCIGFTLANLFKYERGNFATPADAKTTKDAIDGILANITEFESELVGDYPSVIIADFCADVPYKELSCRVQDGVAICEDDLPAIQLSQPIILSPPNSVQTGKITGGSKVQFNTNIPANLTLECNIDGVWTKNNISLSSKPNAQGGTTFTGVLQACVPIPTEGMDCRAVACDLCCNDEGEFEQNCDTVTFKVFPCAESNPAPNEKFGYVRKVPSCNDTNLCTAEGIVAYNLTATPAIALTQVGRNEPFVLLLPKGYLCGALTGDKFTGCSEATLNSLTATVKTATQVNTEYGSGFFNANGINVATADNDYDFIELRFPIVEANCTASYLGTTTCGGRISLTFALEVLDCVNLPTIWVADKTCAVFGASSYIPVLDQSDVTDKLTFYACPLVVSSYTIKDSGGNVFGTFNDYPFFTLTPQLLGTLGINEVGVYTIDIQPNGLDCVQSVKFELTGVDNALHIQYAVKCPPFDNTTDPATFAWADLPSQPFGMPTITPCSNTLSVKGYSVFFRVVNNSGTVITPMIPLLSVVNEVNNNTYLSGYFPPASLTYQLTSINDIAGAQIGQNIKVSGTINSYLVEGYFQLGT